ncbi:Uncharacterised protein [Acinetobacter baumannii]|nr:Uncharacterised protein [Acinetobacter baumannii]
MPSINSTCSASPSPKARYNGYSLTLGRLRKSWASVTRSVATTKGKVGRRSRTARAMRSAVCGRTSVSTTRRAWANPAAARVSSRLASPYDTGAPIARPASTLWRSDSSSKCGTPARRNVRLSSSPTSSAPQMITWSRNDRARSATSPSSACGG